jgi:hypothetical protein
MIPVSDDSGLQPRRLAASQLAYTSDRWSRILGGGSCTRIGVAATAVRLDSGGKLEGGGASIMPSTPLVRGPSGALYPFVVSVHAGVRLHLSPACSNVLSPPSWMRCSTHSQNFVGRRHKQSLSTCMTLPHRNRPMRDCRPPSNAAPSKERQTPILVAMPSLADLTACFAPLPCQSLVQYCRPLGCSIRTE